MKKIQITTVPIKAGAEVIVLNSAFVARIAKSTVELTSTVDRINCRYETEKKHGRRFAYLMLTDRDVEKLNTAQTLINDIYKAFVETNEKDDSETSSKQ